MNILSKVIQLLSNIYSENTGHPIPPSDHPKVKILGVQENVLKRKIVESLYIKANDPILNRNVGKFELPPIYDKLVKNEKGGFLLKSSY